MAAQKDFKNLGSAGGFENRRKPVAVSRTRQIPLLRRPDSNGLFFNTVHSPQTFSDFRRIARTLIQTGVHPSTLIWKNGPSTLSENDSLSSTLAYGQEWFPTVPKKYFEWAEAIALSAFETKWSLLYRLLYRLNFEDKGLLEKDTDFDVRTAREINGDVYREVFRIQAFGDFRKIKQPDGSFTKFGWINSSHPCLKLALPTLLRRFRDQAFTIATPFESASWDLKEIRHGRGYTSAPEEFLDQSQMPLLDFSRVTTAEGVREAVSSCQSCPRFKDGCHAVSGQGRIDSKIMIVGGQPDATEDRFGRPFQGPSGLTLDEVLQKTGLSRSRCFLTKALKHYSKTQTPSEQDITACKPWLEKEIELVKPEVIIALGETSAKALLGSDVDFEKCIGKIITDSKHAKNVIVSYDSQAIDAASTKRESDRMKSSLARAFALANFMTLQLPASASRTATSTESISR